MIQQKDIEMLQYKCTLMPLTPIQIGNGKELSPFDYVIKNGKYYRIEISDIIDKMPENIRNQFIKTLEEYSMFSARKFLKNNYKEEYGYLYKCSIDTNSDFVKKYEEKIGGTGKKNEENLLSIGEFIGTHTGKYIPGSTLKGAVRSAYLADNFSEEDFYRLKRQTEDKRGNKIKTKPFRSPDKDNDKKIQARILELTTLEPKFDPFKNFKITDTEIKNDLIEIKEMKRKGTKKSNNPDITESFEVTKSLFGSNEHIELKFQITIKNMVREAETSFKNSSIREDKKTKEKKPPIVKNAVSFYLDDGSEILSSLNEKAEKIIKEDIEFFKKINAVESLKICDNLLKEKEKLADNQALIRIGRGAGFNSTTFNLYNSKTEEVSTRVTADDMPVGWAVITCEIIEE